MQLKLRNVLQHVNLLVIDECSMLHATTLARLASKLRQVLNPNKDFGGLNILLV